MKMILTPEPESTSQTSSALRRGFTLIELLTVISIIAILITLGAVGISKIGKGQGVIAGLAMAEGMLGQARSQAINQNAPARLIIHSDLNDQDQIERDRYRRMMLVVYQETDNEGRLLPEWKPVGAPVYLPEGVYFAGEISQLDMRSGGVIPKDTFQVSGQPGDQRSCFFYEFNGQGICTTPGAGFVLEAGNRPPGQFRPLLGGRRDLGGFVVLKSGATTTIRDIERLGAVGTR